MTDVGVPPRRTLCFLSTLFSQKVPEKSDIKLRCIISGQPKPEVTWYKNGQAIGECGIASSYEFFENQYVHVLHLYCCTKNDAAIYQISAKNCFGMICCSAYIEVEGSPGNPQLPPNQKDDVNTGWKHETETYEAESTKNINEKEPPSKEDERISLGTPMSADSSSTKFSCSGSLQLLANDDVHIFSSEKPLDVKETRQTQEAYDPNNTEEIAEGFLLPNSSNTPEKQDVYGHRTTSSKVSQPMDGALNNDDPNGEVLNSSRQHPKVQKYISFSQPVSEATASVHPGSSAPVNRRLCSQVSSEDSESDYELCPEVTLTYTEELSDDDLEYLECSDVMTDYSNAVWQRYLQGTDYVFLLESDDEEMEFSECCLGGCGHFFSKMGCSSQVSDNTGPMDATPGFCGYHSQPQEVEVRSNGDSTHSPSSLQPGMTLTLGPHQDGTLMVTEQGRYKLPPASGAAENVYTGVQGETRDSHQAREEVTGDNLLNMDKAPRKMKPGELEKSGIHQCLGTAAEKRVEEKDLLSTRGSQKPARVRQPGIKGKPKKLNTHLKESATEGTLSLLYPRKPAKHPLAQSDKRESSHTRAEATAFNLRFHAECAISTQAEQEAKNLQTPTDSLPREGGDTNFKREERQFNHLAEASQVPDQSEPPQVQIQERAEEKVSHSQMPAGEESPPTGTTTSSLPNFRGIHKENASLAQYLEVESCTRRPQHEEQGKDRADNTPGGPWGDLERVLSISEASSEYMSLRKDTMHVPWHGHADLSEPKAPSVASPEPINTILALENVYVGPSSREAMCGMESFKAGGQGPCRDTMDSSVGTPVDKHVPEEICSMNLELVDGQIKACDFCSTDDKMLEVLFNTQSSEPPQSTFENGKDRNSAVPPLFISTFTWNISQEAREGATGGKVAEVENSTSTLACMRRTDQERPSPSHSGGLLSSKNNSFLQFKGGGESPSTCAKDTIDTTISHSSVVTFPQGKPTTLTAKTENLQATRESEDTSAITIAIKVHPAKYLPASNAEDNHTDVTEESSPQAPDENVLQFPSSVPSSHILNSSTAELIKELPCMAPSAPGTHVHQLSEGKGFCSDSPLQLGNQDKSQTVDRAAHKSLVENFQEKGSETKQRLYPESLPYQDSLSENDLQENLPNTSATQEEISSTPLDHSPGNSREERAQNSGLGMIISVVAEATMEEDSQEQSKVLPISKDLEKSKEIGPGSGAPGNKLKIITLESSVSEIWPQRQLTESECKESEAIPMVWAMSEVLKADALVCELDSPEIVAPASSPRCEADSTSANNREIHGCQEPASSDDGRSLSSQYLSQLRLLESSVDPVDEKESCTMNILSEASKPGGKETINNMSQNQKVNQLRVDHPAFFKQLLTCPQILESSVDPTDETDVLEWARADQPKLPESTPGLIKEENQLNDENLGQKVEAQPAIWQVPYPEASGETIPGKRSINQNQEDSERVEAEQSKYHKAKVEVQPATLQVPYPDKGGEIIPSEGSIHQVQEGSERSFGEAAQRKPGRAEVTSPTLPLSNCLVMTHVSVGVDANSTGQIHDVTENCVAEPRNHQNVSSDSKETGRHIEDECAKHLSSPSGLTPLPFTSSPEGSCTNFSISNRSKEPKIEKPQIGETKPPNSPGSPAMTWALLSEDTPQFLQDPCQKGCTLGSVKKPREEETPSHMATKPGKFPGTWPAVTGCEEAKKKQETSGSGQIAEGVKKKILSRVAALRLKLEEKENVRKTSCFHKKIPKPEVSVSCTDEKKDQKKLPCKREGKGPVLLKKIQAEMFPDHSGNVKLSCQFGEIHEDSTVWWSKDSKPIVQVQRSAGDHSTVSLAIVQASQKDQGFYYCCIKNSYGKVTAEFNLTAEVLKQLSSHQDIKGCEEIEFSQLIFKEDFLSDSYFGGSLRGQIATEELHFGEGVHRKAFRSTVMQGLTPVFKPGHACVLKVHNAIAYGTRNNDELIQRNYRLAAQECYVQNTARYYAKIYAAEAQPLEGFGEVPEIIPIFLIHRPENNIPYATVEEELIGEFVKYSIRDGKEINFLRRESEAGQKCCTFQHWVYQKTSGCLLVTDMQGVGMKLTDVGIATLAKGYKGFKGNCSMTFIDQFKALHQCNKYCKMLGLKSLQNNNQKQKKPSVAGKSKVHPNSTTVKKAAPGTLAEKKT
ncbi:alpha-protein kinase 2 [Elephas maximus indicus]|uniref:alpha-protein kinase 2 n=1 Tax=Elephas maximus indicus TaxID=99487 RepID=UPI002116E63A|nr:alpha-protein kinase 2 [Elephas maximus indicus]XP_049756917.1 alpha-protein kinase 2 [Elephas maximus indicus]